MACSSLSSLIRLVIMAVHLGISRSVITINLSGGPRRPYTPPSASHSSAPFGTCVGIPALVSAVWIIWDNRMGLSATQTGSLASPLTLIHLTELDTGLRHNRQSFQISRDGPCRTERFGSNPSAPRNRVVRPGSRHEWLIPTTVWTRKAMCILLKLVIMKRSFPFGFGMSLRYSGGSTVITISRVKNPSTAGWAWGIGCTGADSIISRTLARDPVEISVDGKLHDLNRFVSNKIRLVVFHDPFPTFRLFYSYRLKMSSGFP